MRAQAILKGFSMRVPAVLALLPLLASCTDSDWNNLLNFGSSSDDYPAARPTAVAAAAPAAPAGKPDNFCLGVARQDATTNAFDTATQQRVAARSYQQCVAIFESQN
jgi:hypothetical protein